MQLLNLDAVQAASLAATVHIDHAGERSDIAISSANKLRVNSVPAGVSLVWVTLASKPARESNRSEVMIFENDLARIGLVLLDDLEGDGDGDGISNRDDNCPSASNPSQADGDRDAVGDSCDNCPAHPDPRQADLDGDNFGDQCDPDIDGDATLNVRDPCPTQFGIEDTDGDGMCTGYDNCLDNRNPGQADCDGDGLGDACDDDADGDGIPFTQLTPDDNCPYAYNPTQTYICGSDPSACVPQ